MPYNMHVKHLPRWQVSGVTYTATANKDFVLTPDVDYRTPVIGAMVNASLTFTGGTSVLSLRWLARWSEANPSVTPDTFLMTTSASTISATGTLSTFVPITANLGPQVPLTGDLGAVIRLNLDSGTGSGITGRIDVALICV